MKRSELNAVRATAEPATDPAFLSCSYGYLINTLQKGRLSSGGLPPPPSPSLETLSFRPAISLVSRRCPRRPLHPLFNTRSFHRTRSRTAASRPLPSTDTLPLLYTCIVSLLHVFCNSTALLARIDYTLKCPSLPNRTHQNSVQRQRLAGVAHPQTITFPLATPSAWPSSSSSEPLQSCLNPSTSTSSSGRSSGRPSDLRTPSRVRPLALRSRSLAPAKTKLTDPFLLAHQDISAMASAGTLPLRPSESLTKAHSSMDLVQIASWRPRKAHAERRHELDLPRLFQAPGQRSQHAQTRVRFPRTEGRCVPVDLALDRTGSDILGYCGTLAGSLGCRWCLCVEVRFPYTSAQGEG